MIDYKKFAVVFFGAVLITIILVNLIFTIAKYVCNVH
jgi:hypothetical protein